MKKIPFLLLFFICLFSILANAANYYWVGGTGNWSDLNHWATTSGGTSFHAQVPTPNDNVIFDSLSFSGAGQSVTLNSGNFLCRSMDWTEAQFNPSFIGSLGDTLEVYGSLTFCPSMVNNFLGDLFIYSTTTQDSLVPNGHNIKGNLIFNGTGTYQLKSNLVCLKNIYVLRGTLNSNGKNITCVNFSALSTSNRGLSLGTSVFTVSGSGEAWNCGTSGFTLTAGSSRIIFSYNGPQPLNFNSGGSGAAYNVVSFLSSEIHLLNSGTFDSLVFVPGSEIIISAQKNQILNKLIAPGTCGSPIILKSSGTLPATITNSGGTAIVCNYLRLSLVNKAGAGSITANNSIIEIAPCANWIVNAPAGAQNFYWIGGAGNWSDPQHWSLSSGGAAGTCIPGPDDNVFFNASSGFSTGNQVTINQNAYCKDMSWLGVLPNPLLAGSNFNLNIRGNVVLNSNMNISFSGNTIFSGNGNQQITSNGTSFAGDIIIRKSAGNWLLNDAFVSTKTIYLEEGLINTQNENFSCFGLITTGTLTKTIQLGSSQVFLSGFGTVWDMLSSATLSAGTSTITCSNTSNNLVVFKGGGLIYHHLILNNSYSSIFASNTFNRLVLTPGSSLTLQSGTTQNIDSLRSTGNCNFPITIECSTMYGAAANISKTGYNTVNVSYVYLRNVTAANTSPARTYNASNSFGQYTTTGWTITNPVAAGVKKYWVGGSGNWSSSSHWSLSSGGPPGTCIPTQNDTVIFNASSFNATGQTVTVDLDAYCKVMDWTGANFNPQLFLVRNLIVKRKAILNPVMQVNRFSRNVQIQFLPVASNVEFDSKRVLINADVVFEGQNLTDSLKLLNHMFLSDTSNFSMVRGTFITNNDSINAGAMVFLNLFPKLTQLGSSYIDLTFGWNSFTNSTMTLNAGTSTIKVNGYNTFDYFYGDGLTYNNVIISSPSDTNTFISGSNTFNNLTINPGVDAKLTAGTTQTVSGVFSAVGNCTDSISIVSSSTTPAIIHKASGVVNAQCLKVKNISRTGAATFNTLFSTNQGGNSGINFVATPPTVANFTTQNDICFGDTAQFTNTSTSYLNGPVTYLWNFGDGSTSTLAAPDHYYNLAGNKVVTLTTILNSNQCSSTKTDTVTVNSPFVFLSTNDNDLTICDGSAVEFNASGLAGSLFQFTIDGVPLGPFSNVDSLVTTTLVDGQTVAVNVSLNGCTAPSPQYFQFTVNPSPVVSLSSSAPGDSICIGSPVTFTASGSHLYRFFVDGIPQGQFSLNNTFVSGSLSNGQVVSVVGKDTLSQCTRQGTPLHTMTVNPFPVPLMTRSTGGVICSGTQVVFTATGADLYQFLINGIAQGPFSSTNVFSTTTLQNGDVVSLKGSSNNCISNSASVFVFTVNQIPLVSLSNNAVNDSICEGAPITFQAGGANTYQFFIDGIAQGPPSGSSSFSSSVISNLQVVTVVGTSSGCSATSNADTIIVSPLPQVTLSSSDPDNILCLNQTVTLTANGGNLYEFFISGISQGLPSLQNILITDSILNGQIVTVTGFSTTGCSAASTNSIAFTVLPAPIVNLYCSEADTTICFGESITFTALGALNYEFFVDGISQGAASSLNTFFTNSLPSGNPLITVQGTGSNGCLASGQSDYSIVVNPIPQILLSSSDSDNVICSGTPVTFYASGGGQYQFFSNGASQGPLSSLDSLVVTNLINGQIISVNGLLNGCSAQSTQSISVVVNPIPQVDIQSSDIDNIICDGTTVDYSGTGAGIYQFYLNGNPIGNPSSLNSYSTDSLVSGDAVFLQGFSTAGCPSLPSDTIVIFVNPLPLVDMICSDPDTAICFGDTVLFSATGAGLYQFFINNIAVGSPNITGLFNTFSLNNNDQITVTGTTNNGCVSTSSDTFLFSVSPLPNPVLTSSDADNKICQGDTVIFYASGAASFEFFIDGISVSPMSANDTLIIDTLLNFQTVSLLSENNGCISANANSITTQVFLTPDVNLLSSATDSLICAGDPIVFTATGAIVNEFFVDGISQGPASANSLFTTSNLSSGQVVSVTGTNVVCPATAPQIYSYTVINYPSVAVNCSSPNNQICFGENVVFTASGATQYQLLLNGIPQGQPGTANVFNLQNLEDGDRVAIKGFNANCGVVSADSFSFAVSKMNLEMIAGPGWLLCNGTPLTVTASGADQYQFFLNGNATGALSANNTYTLNNPSNGDLIGLTGYNNQNACSQSIGLPYYIQLENNVSITAAGSTNICEGDSVFLSTQDTGISQWQNSGTEIIGADGNNYFATVSGNYSLLSGRGGNGRVFGLGNNSSGQIGDSTTSNRNHPVLSGNLENIVALDSGDDFVLALNDSGEVYTWGNNQFGQLGDGTFSSRTSPFLNAALADVIEISAGSNHSLVLLSNGSVQSFGLNSNGQLGLGNNNSSNFPQLISSLTNVQKVSAGEKHSLALLSDSTVWAWGNNQYGQLGDGTLADKNQPMQVSNLSRIVAIACGAFHSMALDADSNVWVWGNNASGQLGLGSVNFVLTPQLLPLHSGFIDIAGGKEHSLLLNKHGKIYSFGANQYGQLGNGVTFSVNQPVSIGTPGNVSRVFAGNYHSFALRKDGSVYGWGNNLSSQISGDVSGNILSPYRLSEFSGAGIIAPGAQHTSFVSHHGVSCESNLIQVNVAPAPPVNIYDNATYLSTDPGVSYQWYLNNNPILNSNSQQQNLMGPGYYFVQVTYANGCIATSPVFSFQVGLFDVPREESLSIYPNPASEEVFIILSGNLAVSDLSMSDVAGRIVYAEKGSNKSASGKIRLDLKDLARGTYFITLHFLNSHSVTKKVILK